MKTISNPGFLTVHLDGLRGGRWGGDVAVEVRDPKTFALRARGVAGGPLDVPEGKHWVGAILPDGQQVSSEESVYVSAGEKKEIALKLADLVVPQSLEQSAWVNKPVKTVADFVAPVVQWFT